MSDAFNIIECGVGGQGVVLMSNVVGQAGARTGVKVISGEMHGLAQRNGSVYIHQRIGPDVLSPLVPSGEADVILSLELMEGLRHIHFLKPGGLVLTNARMIHPPGETMEVVRKNIEGYISAEKVKETIEGLGAKLVMIDALGLAKAAGSHLTENVVMVGALTAAPGFPLGEDEMREGMKLNL